MRDREAGIGESGECSRMAVGDPPGVREPDASRLRSYVDAHEAAHRPCGCSCDDEDSGSAGDPEPQPRARAPVLDLRDSRLANHDALAAALTAMASGTNQPTSVPSTRTVRAPATPASTAPPMGAMNGVTGRQPASMRTGSAPEAVRTAIVITTAHVVFTRLRSRRDSHRADAGRGDDH